MQQEIKSYCSSSGLSSCNVAVFSRWVHIRHVGVKGEGVRRARSDVDGEFGLKNNSLDTKC